MERKTNIEKSKKEKVEKIKNEFINNFKQKQATDIYNKNFNKLTYGQKEEILFKANQEWENYRLEIKKKKTEEAKNIISEKKPIPIINFFPKKKKIIEEPEQETNEILQEENILFNQNPILENETINTIQNETISLNVSLKNEFNTPRQEYNVNLKNDLSSINSSQLNLTFDEDFDDFPTFERYKQPNENFNVVYNMNKRPKQKYNKMEKAIYEIHQQDEEQEPEYVSNVVLDVPNVVSNVPNVVSYLEAAQIKKPNKKQKKMNQPEDEIFDTQNLELFQRRGQITLEQSQLLEMIRDLNYIIQFAVSKGSSADLFNRLPFKIGNSFKYKDPDVNNFSSALRWLQRRGVTDWFDLTTSPPEVLNFIKILQQGGSGMSEKLKTTYKILVANGILPLRYIPLEGQPTQLKTKNIAYLQTPITQIKTENFTVGGKNYTLKLTPKGFEVSYMSNRKYFENYPDAVFFIKSDGFTKKGLGKPISMFKPVIKNLSQAIY